MYEVSVNRKSSTNEWLVSVTIDGRRYEPATSYHSDPQDAVDTAIFSVERYRSQGKQAELSRAHYTRDIVSKHAPEWLIKEAREAARKVYYGSQEVAIGPNTPMLPKRNKILDMPAFVPPTTPIAPSEEQLPIFPGE